MAFPVINEENVYLCTGNPLPNDIRAILETVLNKEMAESFQFIQSMKSSKGLALQDIIRESHLYVLKMSLSDEHKSYLCSQLADME
jgi:replication factor C subunit 3/5